MAVDRTLEFRKLVKDFASQRGVDVDQSVTPQAQSQLNQLSAVIGSEIHQASIRVQELRKLSKSKNLFNDKTNDIETLTFTVKQDIAMLDKKIEALHAQVRGGNRSYQTHASNMVDTLKTRLLEVTKDFKTALELRTTSMEATQQRKDMWNPSQASASNPFPSRHRPTPSGNPEDIEGGGMMGGAQAQVQGYHQSRAEAVTSVQKTITELAQMFNKMAMMVTAQEEMIQRIDADISETQHNLDQGQKHLLKFYDHISSNRMLIIKVFLILMFFVVFFVVFLA